MTPLYLACRQRHILIVKYLLSLPLATIGLNELCSSLRHSIAHIAASKGYVDVLTAIGAAVAIRSDLRWNIDKRDGINNQTALMTAVIHSRYECAKYLLIEQGANARLTDKNGMTLLHQAAMLGHSQLCHLLLSEHVSLINTQSKAGKSALFMACDRGHFETAHLLLRFGANVRLKSSRGKLPLYVAAEKGFKNIVRLLLEQSRVSDLFQLTSYGTTAFFIASKQRDQSIKNLFKRFCIRTNDKQKIKKSMSEKRLSTPYFANKMEYFSQYLVVRKNEQMNAMNHRYYQKAVRSVAARQRMKKNKLWR